MAEEISALDQLLANQQQGDHQGITYHAGFDGDVEIITAQSGIGKVNAAITTALLIEHFSPDLVINTGSAGSICADMNVGDVVVATELIHHDVDVREFGYSYGQVPGMPLTYTTDEQLILALKELRFDFALHYGLIVSGDSFIASQASKDIILKNFPNALALDMESSAIAQTCYRVDTSCVIVRSISDNADGSSPVNFKEFLPTAAANSAAIVHALAQHI